MKKEAKTRLMVIKDYLLKWDWGLAPLFMLSEKDAEAIMELIKDDEKRAEKRRTRYEKHKELKNGNKSNIGDY